MISESTLLMIVARCGGVDPSFRNGERDVITVISRSNSNNHQVVACVKRSVGVDFDATVGVGPLNGMTDSDDSQFADLKSKSSGKMKHE